jgi:hypothetical protein
MEGLAEHATTFGATPATALSTVELWALMVTAVVTGLLVLRISHWFKRNVYQIFDRLWPEKTATTALAIVETKDVENVKKD